MMPAKHAGITDEFADRWEGKPLPFVEPKPGVYVTSWAPNNKERKIMRSDRVRIIVTLDTNVEGCPIISMRVHRVERDGDE